MARWNLMICLVLVVFAQINANGVTNIVNIGGILSKVVETTGTSLQTVETSIAAVGALTDAVKTSAILDLNTKANSLLPQILQAIPAIVDPTLSAVFTDVAAAISSLNEAVGNLVNDLTDVKSELDKILTALTSVDNSLKTPVSTLLGKIIDDLTPALNGVITSVATLGAALVSNLESTFFTKLVLINTKMDTVLDVVEIKIIPGMDGLPDTTVVLVIQLTIDVGRLQQGIFDLVSSVDYAVLKLLADVTNALQNPLDLVTPTLNGIIGSVLGCTSCNVGAVSGGGIGGLLGRRRRDFVKPRAY